MSEVARTRAGWISHPASPEVVGAMANAAAAAEIAIRATAGILGVQVVAGLVREHPMVSILLASGVGYMLGKRWHRERDQQI